MTSLNAVTVAWAALATFAEEIPDPNDVKPGWLGAVVVVGLAAAVVLLILSFRKQLRKVDSSLPSEKGDGASGPGSDLGTGDDTTGPGSDAGHSNGAGSGRRV